MTKIKLNNSLSHTIVKLFRKVNRIHNRQLASLQLTAEQAHLLSVLWHNERMTIGQLQMVLALSSGTMAGAIDRMEKKGLIKRIKNKDDKRITFIEACVPDSTRLAIELLLENTEKDLFQQFTEKERHLLFNLLQKAIEK